MEQVMSMRRVVAFFFLLGCGAPVASITEPAVVTESAWARFSEGLVGRWTATTSSGASLEVRYRLVAHGSALVQTWAPGTAGESITVLHPDGESLMLTHYCGQGNQARLVAVDVADAHVRFRRFDATNVTAEQSVLSELSLRMLDGAHEHVETYEDSDGVKETTTLRFIRDEEPAAPI